MSRAILLNKRRKKKKPVLLPQNTYGEALRNQYNGNLDLLETTDAYKLNDGNTGTAGYIDSLMPPALEQSAPALKLMDEDEANSIFQNPNSTEDAILQAQQYVSGNFTDVPSLPNNTAIGEQTATGILQNPNADPVELNAALEYFSGGALSEPVGSGRGNYGMPVPALDELSAADTALLPAQEMPTVARKDPYMEIPSTKEGYHRMPDGTLMADSEMESDGVLETKGEPKPEGKGILTTTTTASQDRMSSPVTANARGSAMPYGKVGRNEMLMRMGAKMMAGSTQGYGAAMDAAFSEYGNIQDSNRQAETDAFKNQEATRLAEERIAALKAKGSGKETDAEAVGDLRFGMYKLQSGLKMIQNAEGNLTGLNAGAIFSRAYGMAKGSEAEAQRLFLKELGLDAIMKRVQQTKGAISNREMELFGSSTPNINSQEIVWESWIKRQMQMTEILMYRLENGVSVDPNAPMSDTMPSVKIDMGKTNTTTDNNAILDEADAIIGL